MSINKTDLDKATAREIGRKVKEEFPDAYIFGPHRLGQRGRRWMLTIDATECYSLEEAQEKIAHIRRHGTITQQFHQKHGIGI